MSYIKISPEAVRQHATELKSLGTKMQTTMEQVNTTVKGLRADWKDAVHDSFDEEFEQLKQSFDSFIESSIPGYAKEAIAHADEMERLGRQ